MKYFSVPPVCLVCLKRNCAEMHKNLIFQNNMYGRTTLPAHRIRRAEYLLHRYKWKIPSKHHSAAVWFSIQQKRPFNEVRWVLSYPSFTAPTIISLLRKEKGIYFYIKQITFWNCHPWVIPVRQYCSHCHLTLQFQKFIYFSKWKNGSFWHSTIWPGRKIATALKNHSCSDQAAKIKRWLGKAENIFSQIDLSNSNSFLLSILVW